MSSFKKSSREMPEMNTSSLPDLIFTILFFFMIVTTMREEEVKVKTRLPAGTELETLTKKSNISHVYVGPPTDEYRAKFGSKPRMQLNNTYATPDMIKDFIHQERAGMEDATQLRVSLKIDRDTKMSIIVAIKEALRQSRQERIIYTGMQRGSSPGK